MLELHSGIPDNVPMAESKPHVFEVSFALSRAVFRRLELFRVEVQNVCVTPCPSRDFLAQVYGTKFVVDSKYLPIKSLGKGGQRVHWARTS